MAFIQMNIFSDSIGIATPVNIIMPENSKEPPAVLYLLHGLSDDHSMWTRRTSIERYAESRNLAVIMPTTYRGYYTDMENGYNYWTYIAEELPKKLHSMFNISKERDKTFAAGLSMGGYGALKLGLRQPERFKAVAAFSSAADMNVRVAVNEEHIRVFGKELSEENDLFRLAEKLNRETAPKIYMWCGTEDFLYYAHEKAIVEFPKMGYDLTHSTSTGVHSWLWWDKHIQDALDWLPL